MVDFDTAAAAVQDPNADPVLLAKIAYENPEFGANVVANPRAYPGLKRWVAQFGDERARQQLVAMGWPVPQDGIMQQEAETVSEQVQYQMPSEQVQYQPEPFAATPASNVANDASTEYVDPYTNPADLSDPLVKKLFWGNPVNFPALFTDGFPGAFDFKIAYLMKQVFVVDDICPEKTACCCYRY